MICSNPALDYLEEVIRFQNNLFGRGANLDERIPQECG
jgi:hypothetical protein